MKTTQQLNTRITATAEYGDLEHTDYCSMQYTVTLRIGDKAVDIDGWKLCGWLAPGAHANLDGSGLALWGDSQPGGWSVCDGDGCVSGRPRVEDHGPKDDAADDITIYGGEGMGSESIEVEDIPEWAAIIAERDEAGEATGDDGGLYDRLCDRAEQLRQEIIEAIREAITDAVDSVDCEQPADAEEVFDDLDPIRGLEDLPVRIGDWRGAGIVLAWEAEDGYHYTYWPTCSEIEEAVGASVSEIADIIEAALPRDDE